MAVTVQTSSAAAEQTQKDGRAWVVETHRLSNGVTVTRRYLSEDGTAPQNGALAASAAQILADLVAAEITSNINQISYLGSGAVPVLAYSTAVQNFAALRDAYAVAARIEAVMMADFIGTLTNGQIQLAFGIGAVQAAALRANVLVQAAVTATAIRSAVGQ